MLLPVELPVTTQSTSGHHKGSSQLPGHLPNLNITGTKGGTDITNRSTYSTYALCSLTHSFKSPVYLNWGPWSETLSKILLGALILNSCASD